MHKACLYVLCTQYVYKPLIYVILQAVVLVPLNSTLDGIEVTTNFILTHIMLTNSPPNNNEFVTLNGVLGLLTPSPSNNVYTLLTMQAQVQIGTTDKQTFFESMRYVAISFSFDSLCFSSDLLYVQLVI